MNDIEIDTRVVDARGSCVLCEGIGTLAIDEIWYCDEHLAHGLGVAVRMNAVEAGIDADEAEATLLKALRRALIDDFGFEVPS